jgi:hypothetical protein
MADQIHDPLIDQLRSYGAALEHAADHEPLVISTPKHTAPSWLLRHATPIVIAASALGFISAVGGIATRTKSTSTSALSTIGSTVPRVSPSTTTRATSSVSTVVGTSVTSSPTTATVDPSTPSTTAEPGPTSTTTEPPSPTVPPTAASTAPTTSTTQPTTVRPTTVQPTTTTTVPAPTSAAIVSAFPHLQLALPINAWNPPTHARTSRVVGDTIDGAFKSVAQAKDRKATLVLSTVVFTINPTDRLQVRGHPAETIVVENTVTIRWLEAPGITAVLTTTNLTASETIAIALRQVVATSDEEWAEIVASSVDSPPPTPWERVVNGQF